MPRKKHKPEEIVVKLRHVDVLTWQGQSVPDEIRLIGVSEVTYYRWRQVWWSEVRPSEAVDLETENGRLRGAISDLTLDELILQEAGKGNFRAPRVGQP